MSASLSAHSDLIPALLALDGQSVKTVAPNMCIEYLYWTLLEYLQVHRKSWKGGKKTLFYMKLNILDLETDL
jgi:hypothetical protein